MNRQRISTSLAALVASIAIGIGAASAQGTAGRASDIGRSATPGTSRGDAPDTGRSAATAPANDTARTGASAMNDRTGTRHTERAANDEWQKKHRASKIIGTDVRNNQGEKVGDIKDVVIDDHGRVSYLVVSAGGFLGLGDKLFAVPFDQFQTTAMRDHFVLNVDKERMKNSKGFDEHQWPNMADANWISENGRYYGASSARGTTTGAAASGTTSGSTTERGTGSNRTGTTSGHTSSAGSQIDLAGTPSSTGAPR